MTNPATSQTLELDNQGIKLRGVGDEQTARQKLREIASRHGAQGTTTGVGDGAVLTFIEPASDSLVFEIAQANRLQL